MTEIEWTHIPGYTGNKTVALDVASPTIGAATNGASNTGRPLTTRASEALMAIHTDTVHYVELQDFPGYRVGDDFALAPRAQVHHFVDVNKMVWNSVPRYDGNPRNNALSNLRWDGASANYADRAVHGTLCLGERSGSAKITEQQAREIKARLGKGAQCKALAREFKVAPSTISAIKSGKNWGWLNA